MASRALMFPRCRKLQRHVLILLDRKLADASNGRRFFANAEPAERSSEGECDFAKVYARRTLVAFPARRPRRSNPVPSAAARMEARSMDQWTLNLSRARGGA